MLNNFFQKANHPCQTNENYGGPIQEGLSAKGRKTMKKDLELIINSQGLPQGLPQSTRVLVVEAADDKIVVPDAKKLLKKDLEKHLGSPPSYLFLEGVGHALGAAGLSEKVLTWLEES